MTAGPAPVPAHRRRAADLVAAFAAACAEVDSGRIAAIDVVRNPDKLTGEREPG
jgi:hypothetical protein